MNDMRKLMESINKIEESYYSKLSAALDELVANNPNLSADRLVAIARSKYGQEAATFLSDKLEAEADLADFNNSDPQPHLDEVALRRDDEEMLDYEDEGKPETSVAGDAPYYVSWHAQSWEWYGDGEPSKGQGRYKPKADGGRIVAINVPTYDQAQKIADKLEQDYEEGNFEDKNVYSKHGEDYYILDWHGTDIRSMSKMDEWEREELEKYTHPNNMPVDYSGKK